MLGCLSAVCVCGQAGGAVGPESGSRVADWRARGVWMDGWMGAAKVEDSFFLASVFTYCRVG